MKKQTNKLSNRMTLRVRRRRRKAARRSFEKSKIGDSLPIEVIDVEGAYADVNHGLRINTVIISEVIS